MSISLFCGVFAIKLLFVQWIHSVLHKWLTAETFASRTKSRRGQYWTKRDAWMSCGIDETCCSTGQNWWHTKAVPTYPSLPPNWHKRVWKKSLQKYPIKWSVSLMAVRTIWMLLKLRSTFWWCDHCGAVHCRASPSIALMSSFVLKYCVILTRDRFDAWVLICVALHPAELV